MSGPSKRRFASMAERVAPEGTVSNVAAAAALAGLGFDETRVTVIADPAVSKNSVELVAEGRFGNFRLVIENQPSPTNPKTSMTPAMSVLAALRRRCARIRIPA